MNVKKEIRNSIKLILLNENNELLLMKTEDKNIQSNKGKYNGLFWQMIGGKIEDAAYRELLEETGLKKEEVQIGKIVWYGEVDLLMHGSLTTVKQTFTLAKTKNIDVNLSNLTEEEKPVCTKLEWFSLDKINNCTDIVYPVLLTEDKYLPSILKGNIPNEVLNIDLTKQP